MDKNIDILRARAYYYEVFATPFFFYENEEKFLILKEQLAYLQQNPLSDSDVENFKILNNFDFKAFKQEQNDVLFDLSYVNIPLSASFYEEGRDDGAARLRVIEIFKKSTYYRDFSKCKDSEDFVGFIFLAMKTFISDEITNDINLSLSTELFSSVINGFIDEFCDKLYSHEKSVFFKALAQILNTFITLERSILSIEAPYFKPDQQSVADKALNKVPFKTKMPTPKSKIHWEEFTAL
ncbi:hypothetical protein CPIN18021_0050 [Campylobacter pinnipediorum subsp. caledonicus]|uniref:Uncharacterized protein n=1 Tax=Campylobacter pinnipediorum subsp. caledonicus TaxID=1874362 RepID=A0A1S6U5C4_9BACT|nr:formate dehydrogenase-specific chaperone [Campylobacter pinnipediorum]AQW86913.1 hypothetical protein CPIN18021_0050 [Campylobacter pinnipediorum subsp. caledonicus]OPA71906.1 formate dehydrogenase-specific chaperone [Campylobacter pinnipediorum subsp. caledonicus]